MAISGLQNVAPISLSAGRRTQERIYNSNAVITLHRHKHAYAALVLDGAYDELSVDGRLVCNAGVIVIHPPNHAHKDIFKATGARVLNVALTQDVNHLDNAVAAAPVDFAGLERLVRSDTRWADAAILEEMRPLLQLRPPVWLQTLAVMLADVDEPRSVADAARAVGITPEHASRSFARFFGMTPVRFRREHRLHCAVTLLLSGLSPARAAISAGFADQSHLGRVLKEQLDATPAQIRTRANSSKDQFCSRTHPAN